MAARAWLRGWYKTLRIRWFEPDLYRQLTRAELSDWGPVPPPPQVPEK